MHLLGENQFEFNRVLDRINQIEYWDAMQIKNHKIVDADHSNQSPNKRRGKLPKDIIIVLHYTASGGKTGGGDASYLSRASSRASAQVVVGREGDVHQLMKLNEIAWHAGKSSYEGKDDVNAFSIGIEIDNWGWLEGRGIDLPEEDIFNGQRNGRGHKTWERYNATQLAAVEEVIAAICDYYNVTAIVGHEDVSPGRKQDPGPALDEFKAEMQKKYMKVDATPKTSEPTSTNPKTTARLNLRKVESRSAVVLTVIPKGAEVEVIKETYPGWLKVRFGSRVGFVVGKYLT